MSVLLPVPNSDISQTAIGLTESSFTVRSCEEMCVIVRALLTYLACSKG